MPSITFRTVTEENRAMLRQWLEAPHARKWWGDTYEELSFIYDGKGETNERAIAAYMKAGFTPYDRFETGDGMDLLMELLPEDFDCGSGYAQS